MFKRALSALAVTCLFVLGGILPSLAQPATGMITISGAVADARWGLAFCSLAYVAGAPATTTVTCPSNPFVTGADDNKKIIIDDAASTGAPGIPVVTTITSSAGGVATLSPALSPTASLKARVTNLNIGVNGTGYSFGSTQTMTCCSPAVSGNPTVMTVNTAPTINIAGSGGTADNGTTTGTCTVSSAHQSALAGQPSSFLVNLSGGAIFSIPVGSIQTNGLILNDTDPYVGPTYTDTVNGCGSLSGAKLNVTYTVIAETLVAGTGIFPEPSLPGSLPSCLNTPSATTTSNPPDMGTSLTLSCTLSLGTVSYGTDNTVAFKAALTTMNADALSANPRCIYVPGGNYLIDVLSPTASPFPAKGYGCWIGDEHYQSNIFVMPNTQGDAFAWVGSNKNNAQPPFGNTQTFSSTVPLSDPLDNQAGAAFRNITIIGNRQSNQIQNALMFYGKTEFAYIDNCVVSYIRGRAIGGGFTATGVTTGTFNESRIQNCHLDNDGDGPTLTPTFELTGSSPNPTGEAPNTLTLVDLRLFDSWGPGMWIHQGLGSSNDAVIQLLDVVIEGSGMSQQSLAAGDLLKFGDSALGSTVSSNVSNILCRNVDLLNPITNYAALRVAASSTNAAATANLDCEGAITSTNTSLGRGLQIDSCQNCSFKMVPNNASDYRFVLGTPPAAGVTGGCSGSHQTNYPNAILSLISYDGGASELSLTSCIDPLGAPAVQFPARQLLIANNVVPANLVSSITTTTSVTFRVATNTSVSNLKISHSSPLWVVLRSGPTANFSDTWDTAQNIYNTLNSGSYVGVGQVYRARVCNQTTFTETMVPDASETGTAVLIPGGTCKLFTFAFTGVTPTIQIQIAGQ